MKNIFRFILFLFLLIFLVACSSENLPSAEPVEPLLAEEQSPNLTDIIDHLENQIRPIILGLDSVRSRETDSGYSVTVTFVPPVTESTFINAAVLTTSYTKSFFEENNLLFNSLTIYLFNDDMEPHKSFTTSDLIQCVLINLIENDVQVFDIFNINESTYDPLYDQTEDYDDLSEEIERVPSGLTETIVTRVIDGDTLEISSGERVRLIGVDAPERNEPGGSEATEFVQNLVLNQTVWLEADGNNTDRFERLRRYVWIELPTDTSDAEQIQKYQLNALLLINGLAEVMIIGNVRNEALFRSIVQPLNIPEEAPQDTGVAAYIGNRNSQIFHRTTCSSLPAERNRINFSSRQEAIDAGHRACRRCNP